MQTLHWIQIGGLTESFSQVVVGAGAVLLLLMVVALGAFAYRSLTGGVEWPEDEPEDDTGVTQGSDDDEWKFY